MYVHLTLESRNKKVGAIPVSVTERKSCPTTCSFYDKGCYAKYGPLAMHWKKVSEGTQRNVLNWISFCKAIAKLPIGQLWRHNAAGDLPGNQNKIDSKALAILVKANKGKKGFTYSHYPMTNKHNRNAIAQANREAFTINLSADNLEQADAYVDLGIAPVVVVLPKEAESQGKIFTPKGARVVICPASRNDVDISCQKCQLCAVASRKVVVGFPAHSVAKNYVSQIAALPILDNSL